MLIGYSSFKTIVVNVRDLLWRTLMLWLAMSPSTKTFRLQILHTNDMHSHFDEFNHSGMPCKEEDNGDCFGGFPRLKYAVNQMVNEAKNDPAVNGSLFLNAGDTFQGTAFYTVFHWKVVADLLPELGIDCMSLGNHEFDGGVKDLALFLLNINIPVVTCNLNLSHEPSLKNQKMLMNSKVVEIEGRKIGIVGYLTPETVTLSKVEKVRIEDEIPSLRKEVKRLKDEGIKMIIALGHSGFNMDVKIAEEVEDVDLVVGGHSNTFLYSGNPPSSEKATNSYPYCVKQPSTGRYVPVVQAFHATKYLGRLWVDFNDEGEVIASFGNPVLMSSDYPQDEDLLKKVINYQNKFKEATKEIIGETTVFLYGYSDTCRFNECNFGNFLTDAYIEYNIRNSPESFDENNFWTDAPIALQQAGGIRDNIDNTVDDGKISVHQLMMALPFGNVVGKAQVKGSDIKAAIEFSFSKYNGETPRGEFIQVSGLKIVIDLSKPRGQRVVSIQTRSPRDRDTYEKLDLEKMYMIIINEYIWEGGDGFKFSKTDSFKSVGKSDFEIAKDELLVGKKPISPKVEGRIILLNADKIQTDSGYISNPQSPRIYYATTCGNAPKK